ncbi:MAG TPA: HEAT repeat domain-containing protein [Candidatus Omnitrophota bacterium]|nr:HEAT repeat domain-containing protein [Candidatus Omnitrophota bacterium]
MRGKMFKAGWLFWILSGLAVTLTAGPFWFQGRLLPLAAGIHLAGLTMIGFGIWARGTGIPKRDTWQPALIFGGLIAAFFPVAGSLLALIFWGWLWRVGSGQEGLYEQYEAYLFRNERDGENITEMMNALRRIRGEIGFEPLADILIGSDVRMKQKAIKKLSQRTSRESVELLRQATQDPSPDVRLVAAGALLQVEHRVNEKIRQALEHAGQEGGAAAYAELGDLYRMYAETGLVDETLAKYYLTLGLDAYEKSLDLDTQQPRVVADYVRSLTRLEQYDRAKKIIDRFIPLWPQDQELISLKGEVYFSLKLYRELEEFLKRAKAPGFSGQETAFSFWAAAR